MNHFVFAEHRFWSTSNATTFHDDDSDGENHWSQSFAECRLLNIDTEFDRIRIITELIQLTGALLYIIAALREARFLGYKMFIENLVNTKHGLSLC